MILPDWLTSVFANLPPLVGGLGLIICSVTILIVEDPRLSLGLLFMQYVAVVLLTRADLFLPLVLVRFVTGCAACGIVYLSAVRAERYRRVIRVRAASDSDASAVTVESMGTWFRMALAAMSVLIAIGIWSQFPFYSLVQGYGLALLLTIVSALLLIVSSADLLRTGIGLLMLVHAGSVVYLSLEQSFAAILLIDVFEVLVALAVAQMAEAWLRNVEDQHA